MRINNDVLISLVYEKPELWNKNHKLHGNKLVLESTWMEIAKVMKEDEHKLRKKWKYLRDQFAVEAGRCLTETGDIIYEPKWSYFNSLMFLRDVVKPRNVYHSRERTTPERKDHSETSESESHSTKAQNQETINRKRKRKRNEDADEDMLFFKTLLNHVRKIPPSRMMSFRSRIQEVVEQFAYPAVAVPSVSASRSTEDPSCFPSEIVTEYLDLSPDTVKREQDIDQ